MKKKAEKASLLIQFINLYQKIDIILLLHRYGQKENDYSLPISSGTIIIGIGGRYRLVFAFRRSYVAYHFLYLDEIDDNDL